MSNYIKVLPAVSTPIGATLMKTGMTTSYRTGDDGDLEVGWATNFTILGVNNPFGNTNRFTDELGGSTYTNNIVIDWSTYNTVAGTVLGWYRTRYTTVNNFWNEHIDYYLTLSVAGFTSGWRLPNVGELFSILNHSLGNRLNYAPFSINNFIWTSTTNAQTTSQAMYLLTGGLFSSFSTTSVGSVGSIGVRTFTVTGTTLT